MFAKHPFGASLPRRRGLAKISVPVLLRYWAWYRLRRCTKHIHFRTRLVIKGRYQDIRYLRSSFLPYVVGRAKTSYEKPIHSNFVIGTDRVCGGGSQYEWWSHLVLLGHYWQSKLGALVHSKGIWKLVRAESGVAAGPLRPHAHDAADILWNGFQRMVFCEIGPSGKRP